MVLRRFLLFSTSMAIALVIFSPVGAAGSANAIQHPIIGIAKGSTTVDLTTGAGTTENNGYLLGIGLFNASSSSTFAYTGPNTFSGTGTGSLVTANGNELFVTTAVTGTLSGSAVTARTVDTITGGTGRFVGASGQITITARGTSATTVGSTETFTTLGIWIGTISYPVVSLADLAGSLTGTLSAVAQGNGCSFLESTLSATYPGSSPVGSVTLQMESCTPLVLPPTPAPFAGTFALTTNAGTLSGTAAGQITNVSLPSGVYPQAATLSLAATSGTGLFTGTTGTLNVSLQWPTSGSLAFVGTIVPT